MTDETPASTETLAADALEAALAERTAELEAKLQLRLVRAELKAHAIRAGMVAQAPRAKLATEMTDAEWQASRAEMLRRL